MTCKARTLFGVGINIELEQTLLRLVLVLIGTAYGLTVSYLGVFEEGYLAPVVTLGYFYVAISAVSILHVYLWPDGSEWRHSCVHVGRYTCNKYRDALLSASMGRHFLLCICG